MTQFPGNDKTPAASDRFVRSHLKMRHLILLVELGRHASIVNAAKAARLTQPAASRLINDLEHVLGVRLFERMARGVVATSSGKMLIRRAGVVLAEMNAAHLEIAQTLYGVGGKVTVGSVLTPATGVLANAIKLFKSRFTRTNVVVDLSTSQAMVERLLDGQLDIVLGRILDTEHVPLLRFEPISDESHSIIVRPGHPLLDEPGLNLVRLAEQSWIVPPAGSILRDRLSARFLAEGLDPPGETVETLAIPLVVSLLASTDMVVALPEAMVQGQLDAGQLAVLSFDLGLRMDAYGIVTRRDHVLSPGAEALLEALRETVAAGAPQRPMSIR
ncbi:MULTISPECIES: LysR substrate-binding domain-containing protein [unclassified Massilia]|uniref:LysR substrate-binding domain-containing protein n=1 Tax=unclassified Massilia TaxID=2609279 RepID=UPI00177CBF73|nr:MULTISPECIES: LysR substrate-binding domain-containing protein [unclassified Massilia]MBD8529365.1 LysR family transcriptional regulator [Massilia sp. CFBP 13647]MBD8672758.1 LysR family transcriptional regulator [Massilia sp. CFBP 13721]